MKKKEFLEKLQEALEAEEQLSPDTEFSGLSNYDSMSIMVIIAFTDENFNKKISASQFKSIKQVKDLMEVIGRENFED